MTNEDREYLEARRRAHERAVSKSRGGTERHAARAYCKARGLPIPPWAELKPRSGNPLGAGSRGSCSRAVRRPGPSRSGSVATPSAPASQSVTLPRELSELRQRLPQGAIVRVCQTGVIVSLLGERERRFPDVGAALGALLGS